MKKEVSIWNIKLSSFSYNETLDFFVKAEHDSLHSMIVSLYASYMLYRINNDYYSRLNYNYRFIVLPRMTVNCFLFL